METLSPGHLRKMEKKMKKETGQEFLVEISGSNSGSIYYGSMQVFGSQSIDKPNYTTQNEKFVSNVTDNEYIVI
jgi:hypothetical protein